KDTLDTIDGWVSGIRGVCGEIPVVVLGNKADLKDQMQITSEELKDKAASFSSLSHLTSAKTGENVENAFMELVKMALKYSGSQ
ncbi:MAG: hypothetical protein QCI38_07380, partial [Candidatus Thermoplasmatota archaeon]|nr:hypothetical protein [Candidatus Thermoplasmatota archaeon]